MRAHIENPQCILLADQNAWEWSGTRCGSQKNPSPSPGKIMSVALTIFFFYRFHLYWLTCIFFLPWPRTLGLRNYWNVCTVLKHLFKSCFSLKGRYYSQIQSQIKKNKQILSLQALHIGMYQRTYRLPFPFWHADNSPAPQAESWSTCLQPFQIHRPNRKRKKMSKITNKTVDLQKQRGLQMNNF